VMYPEVDYFATVPNAEEYDFDGVRATLTIWYRSLSAMSDSFTAGGFRISAISEPPVLGQHPRGDVHRGGRTAGDQRPGRAVLFRASADRLSHRPSR